MYYTKPFEVHDFVGTADMSKLLQFASDIEAVNPQMSDPDLCEDVAGGLQVGTSHVWPRPSGL